MNQILLVLRLLFGWIAPSWHQSLPLAVRRDGRLVGRREPQANPPKNDRQARGPLSFLLRLVARAIGRLRGHKRGRGQLACLPHASGGSGA
jgi:hypothetical protein